MGFDVTAAYIVFFVAALTAGSAALGAYWTSQDHLESSARAQQRLAQERAHTNLTVVAATYNGGQDEFAVTIQNVGSTVVDISEIVYLVDGAYVPDAQVASATITGVAAATDVWQPTEELEILLTSITSSPTNFKLVAPNGAAAYWGS